MRTTSYNISRLLAFPGSSFQVSCSKYPIIPVPSPVDTAFQFLLLSLPRNVLASSPLAHNYSALVEPLVFFHLPMSSNFLDFQVLKSSSHWVYFPEPLGRVFLGWEWRKIPFEYGWTPLSIPKHNLLVTVGMIPRQLLFPGILLVSVLQADSGLERMKQEKVWVCPFLGSLLPSFTLCHLFLVCICSVTIKILSDPWALPAKALHSEAIM